MKLTLAGLALLLVGALWWQWHGWPPSLPMPAEPAAPGAPRVGEPSPEADPASEPEAALNGDLLDPPPIEQYGSIRERPLFLPDRRPPPEEPELVEEPPPVEAADLAGMQLTAVVIAPNLVSAWVRSPDNAELVRLRIGDDLAGWSVTGIEPEQLSLERQGATNTLKLRDFTGGMAPPVPPLPTARRQRVQPTDDQSQIGIPDRRQPRPAVPLPPVPDPSDQPRAAPRP